MCSNETYSQDQIQGLFRKYVPFCCKKNRVRFRIKFYCYQILHSSNFPHFRCHYWGTYRSGAQVFVYPRHRMRPPATQMTTDIVIEYSPWNLRKVHGQIRNCELSVITHSFVDFTHQINIHQRWMTTSRLIVYVLSSFTEHLNPFPNHATTHRIVTIHLTDLVMNLTW